MFKIVRYLAGCAFVRQLRANGLAELLKEKLLVGKRRLHAAGAVAGANYTGAQFASFGECLNPLFYVAVSNVVVRADDANVSGEQDTLLGQPGDSIAMRVRHA